MNSKPSGAYEVNHPKGFIPPPSSFAPIFLFVTQEGKTGVVERSQWWQIRSGFDDECEVTSVPNFNEKRALFKSKADWDNPAFWDWDKQRHCENISQVFEDLKHNYGAERIRFSFFEEIVIKDA